MADHYCNNLHLMCVPAGLSPTQELISMRRYTLVHRPVADV